jgi:malonyl-CoA decarboxylase
MRPRSALTALDREAIFAAGRRSAALVGHPLNARELKRARRWMSCLRDPGLTEAEALPLAQRLAAIYARLDPIGRLGYQQAMAGAAGRDVSASGVHAPARRRLLECFDAMPDGLRFLIDLRADVLEAAAGEPGLAELQADMERLLSARFDAGLLELRRLTWHSPASLLEQLVRYEAVHAIASWSDLKNRLDEDRRCYAFFHPRLPDVPLIFVEVAFAPTLADNIEALLDESAPVADPRRARTAVFYSISNTQRGLRGLAFGNYLLKRVIEVLHAEFPRLRTFATLSPIPGFRRWLEQQDVERLAPIVGAREARALRAAHGSDAFDRRSPSAEPLALRHPLMRLAAHYLAQVDARHRPLDAVARFHLGNGARLERLNWAGDPSDKGWRQSFGLMVNYLYDPGRLDRNRARLARGRPALGPAVQALLAASGGVSAAAAAAADLAVTSR